MKDLFSSRILFVGPFPLDPKPMERCFDAFHVLESVKMLADADRSQNCAELISVYDALVAVVPDETDDCDLLARCLAVEQLAHIPRGLILGGQPSPERVEQITSGGVDGYLFAIDSHRRFRGLVLDLVAGANDPEGLNERRLDTRYELLSALSEGKTQNPSPKFKLIMVVDDAPTIRHMISEFAIESGRLAVTAENGLKAVENFKRYLPDVVTMDVSMPVMDGIEALEKIMKFDPSAKVAMLTSKGETKLILQALELGAVDYFDKLQVLNNPLDFETFFNQLDTMIMGKYHPDGINVFRSEEDIVPDAQGLGGEALAAMHQVFHVYSIPHVIHTEPPLHKPVFPPRRLIVNLLGPIPGQFMIRLTDSLKNNLEKITGLELEEFIGNIAIGRGVTVFNNVTMSDVNFELPFSTELEPLTPPVWSAYLTVDEQPLLISLHPASADD